MAELARALQENTRAQGGGGEDGDGGEAAGIAQRDAGRGALASRTRARLGAVALGAAAVPLAQGAEAFARGGSFTGGVQRAVLGAAAATPVLGALTGATVANDALGNAQARVEQIATAAGRGGGQVSDASLQQIANQFVDQERGAAQQRERVQALFTSPELIARAGGTSTDEQGERIIQLIEKLDRTLSEIGAAMGALSQSIGLRQ